MPTFGCWWVSYSGCRIWSSRKLTNRRWLLPMPHKPRLAVVSPFIDKRHGTERGMIEWLARIGGDYDIHFYSQRVEDVDLSAVTWDRIPALPGPKLGKFLWWFVGNQF